MTIELTEEEFARYKRKKGLQSPRKAPDKADMADDYIEMVSGARYYPDYPAQPHSWNINDIAHSLSNQCRFIGHCRHFYSGAEHSIICSLLAEERGTADPFECLMHDAHETAINDLARPWKPKMPEYRWVEDSVEADLRKYFDLPIILSSEARRIDIIAFFIEAYYLLPSKGEGLADPLGCRSEALRAIRRDKWKLRGYGAGEAAKPFLWRFEELTEGKEWWWHQDKDSDIIEKYGRG